MGGASVDHRNCVQWNILKLVIRVAQALLWSFFSAMEQQFQVCISKMLILFILINISKSPLYERKMTLVTTAGELLTIPKSSDVTICKRSHRCKALIISHGAYHWSSLFLKPHTSLTEQNWKQVNTFLKWNKTVCVLTNRCETRQEESLRAVSSNQKLDWQTISAANQPQ